MNHELKELTRVIAAYDPAHDLHADQHVMAAALERISQGASVSAPASAPAAAPPADRRRRPVTLAAAGVAACAAVAATILAGPVRLGPVRIGADPAQALSFDRQGDHIDVRILDPNADPARYREEFTAHGMNVDLQLLPASPSLVGRLMGTDDGSMTTDAHVTPLDGGRGCGGVWCKAGVRVPTSLTSHLTLTFGRSARPGESFKLVGDATAPGEPLAGLPVRGRTVAEVRRLAGERDATIRTYYGSPPRNQKPPKGAVWSVWNYSEHVLTPGSVPGGWYVHEAMTGSTPGTLTLMVAPYRADA